MVDLAINVPTAIILLVVAAFVFLAIRRLVKRGMCDCKEGCGDSGGCAHCGAVDKMLADMEQSAKQS